MRSIKNSNHTTFKNGKTLSWIWSVVNGIIWGFNLSHSRELGKQRYSNTSMWTHNEQRDSLNTNSWLRDQIQKKVLEVRLELTTYHGSWREGNYRLEEFRCLNVNLCEYLQHTLGLLDPRANQLSHTSTGTDWYLWVPSWCFVPHVFAQIYSIETWLLHTRIE